MNILAPSILAADFWRLGEQVREVEKAGVQYLHIDVMDGCFVPSISFGMPIIRSIRKETELFLDVHLMIEQPRRYIEAIAGLGADMINFHLEAAEDAAEVIELIRSFGKKAGITIKPETSVDALLPYLDKVDMVLVMTVEPGAGGQKLIPGCLEKVKELRNVMYKRGLRFDIEVDGGVNIDNLEQVLEAGANVIVAGSAIFKNDIAVNAKLFLDKMQQELGVNNGTI